MNKEYVYIDGKAVISSTKGDQTLVDYYDNLDDVLVQENIIETIENKIPDLCKEIERLENLMKRRSSFLKKYCVFVLINILLVCGFILKVGLMPSYPIIVTTSTVILTLMSTGSIVAGLGSASLLFDNVSDSKRLDSLTSELIYLHKQIVMEKAKLVDLKKDMQKSKENKQVGIVKVNDVERLKELKSYLKIASNEKKYYEYYQKGILEEKLVKDENCTEFDLENAKKYFEEKGPQLVKKR